VNEQPEPRPGIDRRRFLWIAGAAAAGVAATGVGIAARDRSSAPEPEPPDAYLGVHSEATPDGPALTPQQAFEEAEALLGGKIAITRHYFGWNESPVDVFVEWSVAAGHLPLISWHAFGRTGSPHIRWTDIAAGTHDDRIRDSARRIRSLNSAVLFSFHHEPEDDIDAIGAQGTCGANGREFVAAFDHVNAIFDDEGVDNARRLVTLQSSTLRGGNRDPDEWVPTTHDWLAVDGYNRLDPGGWRSFEELFGAARQRAVTDRTGLFIQEFGSVEDPKDPTAKGDWIRQAHQIAKAWPECAGLLYSHVIGLFGGTGEYLYRFDSSEASSEAFATLAGDPYFGALTPPAPGSIPPL
jgi:hypothetical protein